MICQIIVRWLEDIFHRLLHCAIMVVRIRSLTTEELPRTSGGPKFVVRRWHSWCILVIHKVCSIHPTIGHLYGPSILGDAGPSQDDLRLIKYFGTVPETSSGSVV